MRLPDGQGLGVASGFSQQDRLVGFEAQQIIDALFNNLLGNMCGWQLYTSKLTIAPRRIEPSQQLEHGPKFLAFACSDNLPQTQSRGAGHGVQQPGPRCRARFCHQDILGRPASASSPSCIQAVKQTLKWATCIF